MIEKNRNILSDAIKKMPVRKPGASVWGAVSGGLDQVNAEKVISDSASRLPLHKAPAGAWKKIAAGLPPTPFINTFLGKLFLSTLITGGLVIAYILFTGPEENDKPTLKETPRPAETTVSQPPNAEDPSGASINQIITSEADTPPAKPAEAEKTDPSSPGQSVAPPVSSVNVFPDPIVETRELRVLAPIRISYLEGESLDKPLGEAEPVTQINSGDIEYAKDMSKAEFKAGIFYAFKRYQNIEEEGMDIPQNQSSAGLELSYNKDRWFFKTGIAYVSWKEKGDYTFDYDQNQLVYQYNYVDSTYINPDNGSITYFTTETFVFDSVEGQQQGQASYDYQMLQIPLMAGYSLFERKNFSIGILGGIGFDIRLSGKQFIPVFEKDGSTLKDVNNSLKYRTTTNWRVIGGLELGYVFAPKWEVFTESTYQWYMKPLYSPDNASGVGLLNIKAGVRYIF